MAIEVTINSKDGLTLQTSGKYCVEDVHVVIDSESSANLDPGNIREGKSILGVSGTIPTKTADDLTANGPVVTVPSGYYESSLSKVVKQGTQGTPTITKSISGSAATLTPSVTNTEGYIGGGTKTGTAVTVSASELVSGTLTITENGTSDCTNYKNVTVNVSGGGGSGGTATTVALTITPTVAMPPKAIYYTTENNEVGQYISTSTNTFTLNVAINTAIAVMNVANNSAVSILGGYDSYLNNKITGVMFVNNAQSIQLGS